MPPASCASFWANAAAENNVERNLYRNAARQGRAELIAVAAVSRFCYRNAARQGRAELDAAGESTSLL